MREEKKKQGRESGEHTDDEMRIHSQRGEEGTLLQRKGHNLLLASLCASSFQRLAERTSLLCSSFLLSLGTTLSFATPHSVD
ncbi:hypothetical protein WN51_01564 [Melipona quadrifasciata]|uniref:Uncharacterized protein n=1 Tax=Melipona quadrifasciata TaxID=166423 RepID=A0A0N0BF26_9HYME|nr:hypothetical protein WN51_01564 [Melipona quadrifasciata]